MVRLFFLLCLLLLAPARGSAQGFSWAAAGVGPQQTVTQALRFKKGLCVVQVSISGRSYDFLFDTGAPTVISKEIRDRISATGIGAVKVLDALGNTAEAPVVSIHEMQLSGLSVYQIPALVYDVSNPVFNALQVQGILGSNALSALRVSVSAQNETISFSSIPTTDSLLLNFTPMNLLQDAQGSPFLPVQLGGVSEPFLFDSGFEGLVDLSDKSADDFHNRAAVAVRTLHGEGNYTGINGSGILSAKKIPVGLLEISGVRLGNVQATITGDSRSKIGAALFQLGDVTLDYPNSRFSFVPYRHTK